MYTNMKSSTAADASLQEVDVTPDRKYHTVRLLPVGSSSVSGISSSYDYLYPAEDPYLSMVMSEEDFNESINKINDALIDHWPCLACTTFAYGCFICTLGLSCYCATIQVKESEDRARLQIGRINRQKNYVARGIKWDLVKKRCKSWIEITFPVPPSDSGARGIQPL